MKHKDYINEAINIRIDLEDEKISQREAKEQLYKLSEVSGIGYEELLSESTI